MRFETTPAFDDDLRHLKREHLTAFRTVVRDQFAKACDAWNEAQEAGGEFIWPKS